MGGEFGQRTEWDEDEEIDWNSLEPGNLPAGLQQWVSDLNHLYRDEPALWAGDYSEPGFFWVDCKDHLNSVACFVRQTPEFDRCVLVVLNLTPVARESYRIGLPQPGEWQEILNSDSEFYGGTNQGNYGGVYSLEVPWHDQPWSAEFVLPPLSCSVFCRA